MPNKYKNLTPPYEMCKGVGCDTKEYCYRYLAVPAKDQIYYKESPLECDGRICTGIWVLHTDRKEYSKFSKKCQDEEKARTRRINA